MHSIRSSQSLLAGRYQLRDRLRSDGIRVVWRAYDQVMERDVVIKGVFSEPPAPDAMEVVEEFQRLKRHAHPHLALPHDVHRAMAPEIWFSPENPASSARGERPPAPVPSARPFTFFTQSWLEGPSLYSLRGRLEPGEIRVAAIALLELVAWLHAQGLTRLDLKSEHVLRRNGDWYLIDLDQARLEDPVGDATLHGTIPYMAPEVLLGGPGSAQADLYSVGAILFEALTGGTPLMEGETLEEVAKRLARSPVPPLSEGVSRGSAALASLTTKLLARRPADRPASAAGALELLGVPGTAWRMSSPLPEMHLVEREELLARLEAAREAAVRRGKGDDDSRLERTSGVAVVGQSGTGRSRLLDELACRWQAGVVPVARTGQPRHPAAPLDTVRLLLKLLSAISEAPVCPLVMPPGAETATSESARETLTCEALSLLRDAGRAASRHAGEPVAILIDDLDHVDELSRSILERILPLLNDIGLFLVVAVDALASGAAERTWRFQDRGLETISLEPLSKEGVRVLAERTLGAGSLDRVTLDALYHETRGTVNRVREVLARLWRSATPEASAGERTRALGSYDLAETRLNGEAPALPPPEDVLDSLNPTAARLLRLASVLASPFPREMLDVVIAEGWPDSPPETVTTIVESSLPPLIARGHLVWEQERTHVPHLSFARQAERRALEETLDPTQRAELHAQIAEQLEQLDLRGEPVPPAVIADHLLAAGQKQRARTLLREAFKQAMNALCLEEAARHLRKMIDIDARGSAELWRQLGDIELMLGRPKEAGIAFEAALCTGRSAPDDRRRSLAGLGWALASTGQLKPARAALETALSLFDERFQPANADRIRLCFRLAWVLIRLPDLAAARSLLDTASQLELPSDSPFLLELRTYEAWARIEEGDHAAPVRQMLLDSIETARATVNRRVLLMALNLLARLEQHNRDLAAARRCLEEVVEVSRQAFDLQREAAGLTNLGGLLKELGDHGCALKQLERAAVLQGHLANPSAQIRALLTVVDLLLERQNLETARVRLLQARSLAEKRTAPDDFVRNWLDRCEASLELEEGRTLGLELKFQAASEALLASGQLTLALEAQLGQIIVALREERLEDVVQLVKSANETAARVNEVRLRARLHRLTAELHGALEGKLLSDLSAAAGGTPERAPTPERRISRQDHTQPPVAWSRALRESAPAGGGRDEATPMTTDDPTDPPFDWWAVIDAVLSASHDELALAETLARIVGERFGGRGMVLLFDTRGVDRLRSFRIEPLQAHEISRTILKEVQQMRHTLTCPDVLLDNRMGSLRSLREGQARSVVCALLPSNGPALGAIYVDHSQPGRVTSPRVVEEVERVARLAAGILRSWTRPAPTDEDPGDDLRLIGVSEPMRALRREVRRLGKSTNPLLRVLLTGETGVGKSHIARTIHNLGMRNGKEMLSFGCGTLPRGMEEAELFGVERHAATQVDPRPGYFEMSRGSTLLLDEIGDLPLDQQQKLLLVLSENRFRRVGGEKQRELDSWLIFATSRDLWEMEEDKTFRRDLLGRIWINHLEIPSLRERGPRDIELLLLHYAGRKLPMPSNRETGTDDDGPGAPLLLSDMFTRRAIQFMLHEYHWPFNVREVELLFEKEVIAASIRGRETQKIDRPDLERELFRANARAMRGKGRMTWSEFRPPPPDATRTELNKWLNEVKINHFKQMVDRCGGNVKKAALRLGCNRGTIYDTLKLEPPPDDDDEESGSGRAKTSRDPRRWKR